VHISGATGARRQRLRRHRHSGPAAGTALAAALALAASGCSGGDAPKTAEAKVAIAPSHGDGKVRPDSPINVQVANGRLQDVTVATMGATRKASKVEGAVTADGAGWRSRWTLDPDMAYRVTATALGGDGMTRTVTSSFRTAAVKKTVAATAVAPYDGETVGVGMPIMLHFNRKVRNREQVERALEVRSTTPVEGAWHWYSDQDVIFRTKEYWPRRTQVRVIGHLSGVRAAKGVYGTRNLDLRFKVGEKHVSVASEDRHRMVVKKNGKKVRTMPISMGRGGSRQFTTTNGTHLAMEKSYLTVMDSSTTGCPPGCPGHYRQDVYWTIRISNSGEFVHSAPWSVGSQGHANVSHGCVNAGPRDAVWFYRFTRRGDVIKVTGTSRELEYDNGWGYWQLSWPKWVKGSALERPVVTARLDGSFAPLAARATAN
jgi:lipoprotein-anchoring transpeptidase ErfK/SrfK